MALDVTKMAKSGAVALALGLGGAVAAPAADAHATTRCVAVAFNVFGDRIRGTRARADRVVERRACRAALRRCRRRLDEVRFVTGRPRPFARCEVVRVRDLAPAPRGRHFDDRFVGGGGCNFRACDARYRSFRASDCSFQPYHGPRRRCRL